MLRQSRHSVAWTDTVSCCVGSIWVGSAYSRTELPLAKLEMIRPLGLEKIWEDTASVLSSVKTERQIWMG